jgi:hypothetical protein
MAGLIGNAPIYVNGLLSLLFVFVLPGLACAPFFRIPEFPERWFVIFLGSIIANHVLVTLIAAFHLDPLLTYRTTAVLVILTPIVGTITRRYRPGSPLSAASSTLYASDLGWLLAGVAALAITYRNVWTHGVPNIFNGGDTMVSWNAWALIWSQGNFPTGSLGYPQFIPTLWAVTYISTGSPAQYFAFYIYLGLIVIPILLNAMVLGRISRWDPLVSGLVFIWFIVEIRSPWLQSSLQEGYPDWVAAICAFCGVVLFAVSAPAGRYDGEKRRNALLALCLVSIATAIKPLNGLFAVAVLAAICIDAWRNLKAIDRNRFMAAAAGLLAVLAILYAINYVHLAVRGMPNFPVASLWERWSYAAHLFNSSFTIPFRIVVVLGFLLCPFVKRLRWLAMPLYAGTCIWATTAAYDLRNLFSFLLVGAFVPLYSATRLWLDPKPVPSGRQWLIRDGTVTALLALAALGLTLPLAASDRDLERRFANDQLRVEAGIELNREVGELLDRGCRVFSSAASMFHIAAFGPYLSQMEFFFYTLPLDESLTNHLNGSSECRAIIYPPSISHPSILNFIADYARTRSLKEKLEGNGMELLVWEQ